MTYRAHRHNRFLVQFAWALIALGGLASCMDSSTAAEKESRLLVLSRAGDGHVVSEPPGIDCGSSCTRSSVAFPDGTAVRLLATAPRGWVLAAWGGLCTGAGACEFILASDAEVSAAFVRGDVRDGGTPAQLDGGVTTDAPLPSVSAALMTRNESGRSGWYYLPPAFNQHSVPVLLAYHGSGGSGYDMAAAFEALALTREFIIVAPDSRISSLGTWEVGNHPGEVTPDYTHALACLEEVLRIPGVNYDRSAVMAVGFSGGGSSAPYLATNDARFGAYAVLHGGVIPGGMGTNRVRGWFSTGTGDTVRSPAAVRSAADYMLSLGFADVTFNTYPIGHSMGGAELSALVEWWLN